MTLEQLQALVPEKQNQKQTKATGLLIGDQVIAGGHGQSQYTHNNPAITPEQMEDFMASYGLQHAEMVTTADGRLKWVLEPCPFNEEHNNKDAAIFLTDGKPGFKCFHNTDADKDWKSLRAKLELEQDKKFHFFHVNAPQAVSADADTEDTMFLEWATDIKPETLEWLWPSRIPIGKLTLFVGHPDVGKGMATIDIAARTSTGRDWPDGVNTIPPSQCIIVSSEDAAGDTLVPRLMAAEADLKKIAIHRLMKTKGGEDRAFSLDKDLPALRNNLEKHPNIKLVVIDPLFNHLGTLKGNVEQEMRSALTPLASLAEQFKVAIILVTHFNKNVAAEAIQRVGGAQAVVGSVRVAWLFAKSKDDEDQRSMISLKANITDAKSKGGLDYDTVPVNVIIDGKPTEVGRISWGKTTHQSAANAMSTDPNNAGLTKIEKAKLWLTKFLASGEPMQASHVQDAGLLAGFTPRTTQRASHEINVTRTRPVNPGPWYWRLGGQDCAEVVDEHEGADAADLSGEEAA